ncbi:MAG: methyltransferase domain-containing protein [Ignavibacteria bacterium]|nr:methyltransferase domain-containing protein [Ignavibacteria bacterium]
MGKENSPGKEMWDERFSSEEYVYGKEPNQFLKSTYENNPAHFQNPILLLGDGEGRNGVYLASEQFDVTSLDFSEKALAKVRLLAEENNVTLKTILSNINEYEFKNDFWGTTISIYFHLDSFSRKKLHQNVKSSLKSNGIFLLEAYSPRQLQFESGGPKNIDLLYTVEELKNDFNDFEIIQLDEVETILNEGILHQGKASVVRFLGRKK